MQCIGSYIVFLIGCCPGIAVLVNRYVAIEGSDFASPVEASRIGGDGKPATGEVGTAVDVGCTGGAVDVDRTAGEVDVILCQSDSGVAPDFHRNRRESGTVGSNSTIADGDDDIAGQDILTAIRVEVAVVCSDIRSGGGADGANEGEKQNQNQ